MQNCLLKPNELIASLFRTITSQLVQNIAICWFGEDEKKNRQFITQIEQHAPTHANRRMWQEKSRELLLKINKTIKWHSSDWRELNKRKKSYRNEIIALVLRNGRHFMAFAIWTPKLCCQMSDNLSIDQWNRSENECEMAVFFFKCYKHANHKEIESLANVFSLLSIKTRRSQTKCFPLQTIKISFQCACSVNFIKILFGKRKTKHKSLH